MRWGWIRGALVWAMLVWGTTAQASDWVVKQTLTPNPAQTTDIVTLTVTVAALSGESPAHVKTAQVPNFDGFLLVNTNTFSQAAEIQPGVVREAKIFAFALRPHRNGTLSIEEVLFDADGSIVKSEPVELEVVAPTTPSLPPLGRPRPPANKGRSTAPVNTPGDDFFLQTKVKPDSVYVGQTLFVRYDLYRKSIIGAGIYDLREPDFKDFWPHDATDENQNAFSTRKHLFQGKSYESELLRAYILVPLSAGPHEAAAIEAEVTRGNYAKRWIGTAPYPIEVKPLPAGAPAGFDPSNVTADPVLYAELGVSGGRDLKAVRVGDSLSLSVKLSGTGAITQMELAPMAQSDGLQHFDPRVAERYDAVVRDRLEGRKRFAITMVPLREGTVEVPPVRFVYFDPEEAVYKELVKGPWTVEVTGFAPNAPQVLQQAQAEQTAEMADQVAGTRLVAPPRSGAGEGVSRGGAHYQAWWFLLLMVFPPLSWVGLELWSWRGRRREEQSDVLRTKGAAKTARKALRAARKAEGKERLAAVESSLREYLEARHEVRSRSMTGKALERALTRAGASPEVAREVVALFSDIEAQRYAPAGLEEGLGGWVERAESVLSELESMDRGGA